MGRNNPHCVRPVRRCLGRQSRSRLGSLRGHHRYGRLSVAPPAQSFQIFRQIALFVIGVAGNVFSTFVFSSQVHANGFKVSVAGSRGLQT